MKGETFVEEYLTLLFYLYENNFLYKEQQHEKYHDCGVSQ